MSSGRGTLKWLGESASLQRTSRHTHDIFQPEQTLNCIGGMTASFHLPNLVKVSRLGIRSNPRCCPPRVECLCLWQWVRPLDGCAPPVFLSHARVRTEFWKDSSPSCRKWPREGQLGHLARPVCCQQFCLHDVGDEACELISG